MSTRLFYDRPLPWVSVMMTTYNGEKFICDSIDSILRQTFSQFELIIVDDASTDNTSKLVAAYCDSRIRYTRLDRNVGIATARNHAIALARGTYIAALDHDDLSHPTRLAKQVALLNENPDLVLVGSECLMLENGCLSLRRPFFGSPREAVPFFLHLRNDMAYSSIMFRASSVEQFGKVFRTDYEYADDYDLYHRLLSLGSIDWIDEPLTTYRIHAANTSRDREKIFIARAVSVLASVYVPIFGEGAQHAAELIGRHVVAGAPLPDRSTSIRVCHLIAKIACYHLDTAPNGPGRETISACAAQMWWRVIRNTTRSGRPHLLLTYWQCSVFSRAFFPAASDIAASFLLGLFRLARLCSLRRGSAPTTMPD